MARICQTDWEKVRPGDYFPTVTVVDVCDACGDNAMLARVTQEEADRVYDLVGNIIRFEQGELNDREVLRLFSVLIKSGQAWTLQGMYGRAAQGLIENDLITREGVITEKGKGLYS